MNLGAITNLTHHPNPGGNTVTGFDPAFSLKKRYTPAQCTLVGYFFVSICFSNDYKHLESEFLPAYHLVYQKYIS